MWPPIQEWNSYYKSLGYGNTYYTQYSRDEAEEEEKKKEYDDTHAIIKTFSLHDIDTHWL